MAKYGSNSIVVEMDDAAGVVRNVTQHILTSSAVELESVLEESHAFGDSWREHLATGLQQMNPITFGGFYDDTAITGPHVVFGDRPTGPASITKTLKVTWGGAKYTEVETHIQKYRRIPSRGALTRFEAELQPTGAVTEA